MKYQCLNPECKKTFLQSALLHVPLANGASGALFAESHCCPFCHGLDIEEFKLEEAKIISVLSVPLEDVDAKLKDGYQVHELYAKTATLTKKA